MIEDFLPTLKPDPSATAVVRDLATGLLYVFENERWFAYRRVEPPPARRRIQWPDGSWAYPPTEKEAP